MESPINRRFNIEAESKERRSKIQMPIRVTFRVKWGSSLPLPLHERHPIAKKQRTTNVPRICIKSEIVNTVEELTDVKTEEIDGSTACDLGSSESALWEPSYDDNPHLSHSASTSSTTSKQFTSHVGTSDNAEMCASEGRLESDMDSLSNKDSENLPMNNVFSELQCEEGLEYKEVAQNSTAHQRAAIPFVLNTSQKRKYPSWDERFKELFDFKKVNGHTNVPQKSGPLGIWVTTQRTQYRLLKEGKYSLLTIERHDKLEGIGFTFIYGPARPHWDVQFQELLDFKKIEGHTNVPQKSGPLGIWVETQRTQYRLWNEGKHSTFTIERSVKLEGIGFRFKLHEHWDVRFQELVDLKKINGHTNVPERSGPLGIWVGNQRYQYRLLKERKDSSLTIERREKLEGIGFQFKLYQHWDVRFQELVDFKKIKGHTNVPQRSGPLGNWVNTQRVQYRLLKEGKHSTLTIERSVKLESIVASIRTEKKS
eukprot:scaffold30346_cov52-Attheya_sp.AAC.1